MGWSGDWYTPERNFRRLLDFLDAGTTPFETLGRVERVWLEIQYRQYPKLATDSGTIAEISKWARTMRTGAVNMAAVANTGEMTGLAMLHAERRVRSVRLVESGAGAKTPDFEAVLGA